jgi:hypothetical protein
MRFERLLSQAGASRLSWRDFLAGIDLRDLGQAFGHRDPGLPQNMRYLGRAQPRGIVLKSNGLPRSIHIEFPQSISVGKFCKGM